MSSSRQFEPVLSAANDDSCGKDMSSAALRELLGELLEPVKPVVTGWARHPLPQIRLGYRAFRLAHGLAKSANDA
jgi:hypothetical protein